MKPRSRARLEEPSDWIFNRLAQDYLARPPYPASLWDDLSQKILGKEVLDLGAGTGLASLPLARRGFCVTALEPAEAMRAALLSQAEGLPIQVKAGTAEETHCESRSFDAVIAAEAAQWFELGKAVTEGRRVLRPGGLVAAIEWAPAKAPLATRLQALLLRYNPKTRGKTNEPARRWVRELCRTTPKEERFLCSLRWTLESFLRAVRSFSYVGPALGPAALQSFEGELTQLLRELYQEDSFEEPREAILCWGRL